MSGWKHDDHVSFRVLIMVAGPVVLGTSSTFLAIVHQVALCVITACICAAACFIAWTLGPHREASRGLYRPDRVPLRARYWASLTGQPRPQPRKAVEQRPAVTLVESRVVDERGKVGR